MKSILSLATATAILSSAALAQNPNATHPTTIPEMYTGSFGQSQNLLPMARSKAFIQYYISGANINTVSPLVRSLGWRRTTGGAATPQVHKLEIQIGYAATTFSTMSKTFASNFSGTPTVFFALKNVNFPGLASTDPDKPDVWINADRPFINNQAGKDWIVQVDIQTEATPRTISGYNCDAIPTGSSGVVRTTDPSCGGTLTTSYSSGNVNLGVTGTQAASPVVYLAGLNLTAPADLGSIFGSGCSAVVLPLIVINASADTSGAHSFSFPLATPTTDSLAVHFQAIHLLNSQLVTTNATHLWLGSAGAMNYVYNWTTFTPTAQYGPYTSNRGAIHLIR